MSEIIIIDGVLNTLHHSLIGTQFLIEHYLSTEKNGSMVDPQCSPVAVASSAAKSVKSQFASHNGSKVVPDIIVHGDIKSTFAYVPSHLSQILEEVFSNAVISNMMHSSNHEM